MNVRARLSILLCILSFVAGCRHIDDAGVFVAAGGKESYEWRDGNFRIESTAIVAVAVLDRRSYVLSGERPLNFTGISHNDVYLPFYVVTVSGYPLARDFGESIAQALRTGGTESFRVDIRPTQDNEVAKQRLLSEDADRFVLVKLWEWSTDTYWRTGPRKLDSALSEIFLGCQAANSGVTCS
jgi:hypothetical protein